MAFDSREFSNPQAAADDALARGDHSEWHRLDQQARMERAERMRPDGSSPSADVSLGFWGWLGIAMYASVAVGIVCSIAVMIGWWAGMHETLRSILGSSPISGAIADTPHGDGSPVAAVIGTLIALVVVMIAISVARRWIANRCAVGEIPGSALFGITLLRTCVAVAGLTLVPIVAAMATGQDLRRNQQEFWQGDPLIPGAVPILLLVASIIIFSLYSYVRAKGAAEERVLAIQEQ